MTALMRVGTLNVTDGGGGLYFLTDPAEGERIRATFYETAPGSRWWVGRDLFGAARELYVETHVKDQVFDVAERLTSPA